MEKFNGRSQVMVLIVRTIALGIMIIHLVMMAMDAQGQAFKPAGISHPENPFNSVHARRNKVRQIYTSQLGVREKQPNSGLVVEKYLRYVNLPKGNPWCAAFVCWVFGRAGVDNPRTGWSPGLFGSSHVIWARGEPGTKNHESRLPPNVPFAYPSSQATRNSQLATIKEPGTKNQEPGRPQSAPYGYPSSLTTNNQQPTIPRPADIFGLYFPEKRRIAHVGFIDEWDDPWVVTVEGNANVRGSREGDGVHRKRRLMRSVYKVARYVE